MQVLELIRKYDFHDSCVIQLNREKDTIKMTIDLCMWKQDGYIEREDEQREVVLKFNLVKDYTWDSDKKEEDIDYATILEIEYKEDGIKMVLLDESISIITFKCCDVDVMEQ